MSKRIPVVDALMAIKNARRDDEVVITVMGSAREWMKLGSHPRDFVLVPSSMGQGTSLGLGIALAQPKRKVIVCNGDGSMLMNLGTLVTITAQSPANLVVLVFDNGIYEVTGGQSTPGAAEARHDQQNIDFAAMARACGFKSVFAFDDVEKWRKDVRQVLDAAGPTLAVVKVVAMPEAESLASPGPGKDRVAKFRAAIAN